MHLYPGVLRWRGPTHWATRGRRLSPVVNSLASRANPDVKWWPQRIRRLRRSIALPPVVDDAHRRMDQSVLHCLRAWRELTNRDIQFSIDHVIRWPRIRAGRPVVEQVPRARGEAEHRQHAGVGKSLAENILLIARVRSRPW